jgi:hypothetical protein
MVDDSQYIQKSADILNLLIQRAATTAVGTTASAGQAGQKVTVNLGDVLGSIQGVCLGSVVPGPVEARKAVDGTWYIMSPYEPIQVAQVRRIRRRREDQAVVLSFAFLYQRDGRLYLGGLFPPKEIDHGLGATALVASSIHHRNQAVTAIAKMGFVTLLRISQSGAFQVFTDSRVTHLSPRGGGVWTGVQTIQGTPQTSQSNSQVVNTSVVEAQELIYWENSELREFIVGGVQDYYVRAGGPELGAGIQVGGQWWSRNIGIIILPEPVVLVLAGYNVTVYRAALYLDYRSIITNTGIGTFRQTNSIRSYLYYNGAIEEGLGSEVVSNESIAVASTDPNLSYSSTRNSTTGSGETCILPGVKLPWHYSRIESSRTGSPTVTTEFGSRYSQPLLINNAATSAIVSLSTVNQQSSQIQYQLINKVQSSESEPSPPPTILDLDVRPVFAARRTASNPINLEIGVITIALAASLPPQIRAVLPGMPIVFSVQSEKKVTKAIGLVQAFSTEIVNGQLLVTAISIDATSVVRTDFDSLATPEGTIYSNNGSILGLFNSNPNFSASIDAPSFSASPIQTTFTRFVWDRNNIYVVNTSPLSKPDFGTDRIHQADVWKLDLTVDPITIFKQPRCATGGKAPISPNDAEATILRLAGSYWP